MTNSLQAMAQRRDQWLNEKPQGNFGQELRLKEGDQVYFQFVSSGKDGDLYILVYKAHAIDAVSNSGKQYQNFRYCMKANEDLDCQYCAQGHGDLKERMSIWMYVTNILHTSMPANTPPDKMLPQVNYQNRIFFKEEVNDFKVWHTSAWRESPWADILKLDQMYDGLSKFSCELIATGSGFNTRFKLYAIPNSAPVAPELYTAAKEKCQPVKDILKAQLAGPLVANPNPQPQQTQQNNSGVIAWTPPGGGGAPATNLAPFNPGAPAMPAETPPWEPSATPVQPTEQPSQETPQNTEAPAISPQDLPIKSMF